MKAQTQDPLSMKYPSYISNSIMGLYGWSTVTGQSLNPMFNNYMNILNPAGCNVKIDLQRHKRMGRLHLPDVLKGPNQYLKDSIDCQISYSASLTSVILPFTYIENPDQKISWWTFSYDEGLASRVQYESAASTLTQSKRSFTAFMVRHGLAINMEHNFMTSY